MAGLKLSAPGRETQDFKDYKYSNKKSKMQLNGHIFYMCSIILYYVDVYYILVLYVYYILVLIL